MQKYSIMILCLVSSFACAMENNKDKEVSAKERGKFELLPLPHGSLNYFKKVVAQEHVLEDQFSSDIDKKSEKRQRFGYDRCP